MKHPHPELAFSFVYEDLCAVRTGVRVIVIINNHHYQLQALGLLTIFDLRVNRIDAYVSSVDLLSLFL
jgi:hypothetical protein